MFDKNWEDDFDRDFERAGRFVKGWFIFIALLTITILLGLSFVAYKLLLHFGIL